MKNLVFQNILPKFDKFNWPKLENSIDWIRDFKFVFIYGNVLVNVSFPNESKNLDSSHQTGTEIKTQNMSNEKHLTKHVSQLEIIIVRYVVATGYTLLQIGTNSRISAHLKC